MFVFICSTQQRWSGCEKITFCRNSGVSATIRSWDLDPHHQDGEVSGWLLHQDAAYGPKHPLVRPHEKLQSACWLAKGYREDPWTPPQACWALCPPLRACPLPNHPLGAHPRQSFAWEKMSLLCRHTGTRHWLDQRWGTTLLHAGPEHQWEPWGSGGHRAKS